MDQQPKKFTFLEGELDPKNDLIFTVEDAFNDIYSKAILMQLSYNQLCLTAKTLTGVDIIEKYHRNIKFGFQRP